VRVKNEARVEGGAVGRGVLMPRAARSTIDLRSTASRPRASFGPGGRCCSAEIPAQAQVAAWARGCAGARGWAAGSWAGRAGVRGWAAGCWAGCAGGRAREQAMGCCWIGPKWPNKIVQSQFLIFLFSRKQFDQFELNFYDNFLYKIYPTIFFVQ